MYPPVKIKHPPIHLWEIRARQYSIVGVAYDATKFERFLGPTEAISKEAKEK